MKSPQKVLWITLAALLTSPALAGPTRVGNGDEGADLEKLQPVKKGKIVEARKAALARLRQLNTAGVAGLGTLLPEVEHSELYLAGADVPAQLGEDQGIFHADMRGQVFARTLAEPHAATRFFPVAETLAAEQLLALQVHEALHRALPASVRQDESVVSSLTLAITAPQASHDSIQSAAQRWIPETDRLAMSAAAPTTVAEPAEKPLPEDARVRQPSRLSYEYRHFRQLDAPSASTTTDPVHAMHVIHSDLYPFGGERSAFGMGVGASLISRATQSQMGPLGLSARLRVWSSRDFDVALWTEGSFNVLSAEELKNSLYGRDAISAGISMRKDLRNFTIENLIGYTAPGSASQRIGAVDYEHQFGGVISVNLSAAARIQNLRLGGYAELDLANYYRVVGGAFTYDSGRYRLLSVGPRVTYETLDFAVSVYGRFIADSTRGATFDFLGNLLRQGVAQGTVGASVSLYF